MATMWRSLPPIPPMITPHRGRPMVSRLFLGLRGTIHRGLYILTIADGSVTRLTDDSGNDFTPVWSPDGERIAFTSTRGGETDIWTIAPDGSALQQVTNDAVQERHLDWSGDDEIVFVGRVDQHTNLLYTIAADGTNQRQIYDETLGQGGQVAVSPDGKCLLYATFEGNPGLYVLSLDDGVSRPLTLDIELMYGPAWSPRARCADLLALLGKE